MLHKLGFGSRSTSETGLEGTSLSEIRLKEFRPMADELIETHPQFSPQSDADLMRYLRARQFNVEPALDLLKLSEAWRLENTPIDPETVKEEINSGLAFISGLDRSNRAVIYIDVIHFDKHTRDLDSTTHFAILVIAEAIKVSQKHNMEQVTFVFDLKHFGVKTMDYSLVKNLLFLLSNAFPERTAYMLIVGAPLVFKSFWAAIKPWIDEGTAKKIRFPTQVELLTYVDSANLPNQLEGSVEFKPVVQV
mmetsp:Transcript_8638/g.15615  ORF Transcript_8638/g.15615 Transcript_8638/m.15615 type:complete len:249 (+) Transcript_8638:109-855(+)